NYFTKGEVRHAVNMAAIDPKTLEAIRGYLDLAYRLGLLMAPRPFRGATACHLAYRGDITQKNTKLITAAFCAGLLEKALAQDVNVVNAQLLRQERGIKLNEESQTQPGAFSSSMSVEVTSAQGEKVVASGTL